MKIERCLTDLQLEVIYNDSCIKCGSCGAFCPNIYFDEGNVKYKEQCSETVGICYNACPRAHLDVAALDKKIFGKARENQALGVYSKALRATLKDQSLKDVATALLASALDAGLIDSAVVPDASVDKRLEPVICKEKAQLVANAGERKGLGPIVAGAGKAIHEGNEAVAVLGRPCHGQGIAKLLKSEDFLVQQEKIKLLVSQFCLAQGKGCTLCLDYSGEFSDISLDPKTGDILVRTPFGQKVIDNAISAGVISVNDIDVAEIAETAMKKKSKNVLKVLAKNKESIEIGFLKIDAPGMKALLQ